MLNAIDLEINRQTVHTLTNQTFNLQAESDYPFFMEQKSSDVITMLYFCIFRLNNINTFPYFRDIIQQLTQNRSMKEEQKLKLLADT